MKIIAGFILGLALVIFGIDFFTQSGIYFFLDTLFYPIYGLQGFFEQTLYLHIRDISSILLGYKLYAKIFLVGVFIVGTFLGISIGKLINKILQIKGKSIKLFNILLGIVFIVINPFTYERFITQTEIILGVYLIGLGLVFLTHFLLKKQNKNLYISFLFFGLSLTIFPHSIIFLAIIGIISLLFYLKSFSVKNILYSLLIIVGINFNWIIGNIFFQTKSSIDKVETFNFQNIEVFSSNSLNNLGTEFTNLLLYGFWGERYKHVFTPDMINEKWYIAGCVILFIVGIGIFHFYKKQKKLTLYLVSIGIVSYILSLGISSEIFKNINLFLYHNVPYYIGMREPQKLTGLVMILYAVFFVSGTHAIYKQIKKYKLKKYISKYILNIYSGFIILFLLISAWSPNVLFGFNSQLRISDYPKDFFKAKSFLEENEKDSTNLILPWHSYMSCSWTYGHSIANMTPKLLEPNITLRANNIEIGGLYTNNRTIESQTVETFLKNKDYSLLKNIRIDNIIFTNNCADYKKYDYLEETDELKNIFDSENIKIFKLQ